MKLLIGLHGKAGSGKTTVADYLEEELSFERLSFAKALKDGVGAMFGFSHFQLYGGGKEIVVSPWNKTPREILQAVGVALQDAVDPDIWIKCVKVRDTSDPQVFEDVRYKNEVQWLLEQGGHLIILKRGGHLSGKTSEHISEQPVQKKDYPDYQHQIFEIDNQDWSNEQLLFHVGQLVAGLQGEEYSGISPLVQSFRDALEASCKGKYSFAASYEDCVVSMEGDEDHAVYTLKGREDTIALYAQDCEGQDVFRMKYNLTWKVPVEEIVEMVLSDISYYTRNR